ncbi:Rid family hydrolase [Escherichia coli]|nr:Rid family hydrolase [Escherichia coli]MCS1703420.1 Rid family hydrolase [Escherichia coli]
MNKTKGCLIANFATVPLNAYLTDVNMFPRFNAIMSEYFSPPYPARATLGIAALPQGAVIEIEAIMVL